MVAIRVDNISKSFKIPHEKRRTLKGVFTNCFKKNTFETFNALNNVSFEIKKGKFFGIIGRNGSGKSTMLKILAGIYVPDKGKIAINGRVSPFLELGVGFNPELSGRENIYLNASILGMSRAEIDKKFEEIVVFSELERFLDQKLKNYSSGMQVRLGFSVAIHANKDILLMDEVLAVGDTNFQQKCLEIFNKYKEEGKTIVLVTHDVDLIQRYCDSALLLRQGELVKAGRAEDVVDEYVYQNIADQEEQLESCKEAATKGRKGKGSKDGGSLASVEIRRVAFLNGKGEETNSFERAEDIVIRVYYRSSGPITDPVVGIAIDSSDGDHVIGPNSKKSGFLLGCIDGEGFVDLKIEGNPLNRGMYLVTVGFFNANETVTYDFQIKKHWFKVLGKDNNQNGVVGLDLSWAKS